MTEETNVFGVADDQVKRVTRFILAAREFYVRAQVLGRLIPNVYQSLIYIILAAGLLAISASGVTGLASLGAVVLILIRAGSYGQTVQSVWVNLRQCLPYVERLQNSIHSYESQTQPTGDTPLEAIETLDFEAVDYHYRPDRPVLRNVSWRVQAGETIGVIGPSGAGKSTMMQILLRLRDARDGRYLINGIEATKVLARDWHERIAYVPQTPKLLHASVIDNVRFFRNFDEAAVERACRLARIHDEVMSWPAGYDTIVGPRADAVSGGQQQRICLARALVSNPRLLILDEPTSSLDPRSESLIQLSLEALDDDVTVFIVAHRMSTLTICDRIMVIIDGKLDDIDTLDELSESNDYYRFASGVGAALDQRADA
jgi:ATP-binding cassette subfamily B protein